MTANSDMRQEYRLAFEQYSETAGRVRRLLAVPSGNSQDIDAAMVALEIARSNYAKRRDALAEQLSPCLARVIARTAPESRDLYEARVRTLARLLWEAGGRRDGAATADWRRAEDIIGRARVLS